MSQMNEDVFKAILAMDSYNRGYDAAADRMSRDAMLCFFALHMG
jgi:hypothetical protein